MGNKDLIMLAADSGMESREQPQQAWKWIYLSFSSHLPEGLTSQHSSLPQSRRGGSDWQRKQVL